MDKKLAALATEYNLVYTRYADDLTFSGDVFPAQQILPLIKQIIREEKFEINHKKTRFLSGHKRKIITGVSISSGMKLTIPKAKSSNQTLQVSRIMRTYPALMLRKPFRQNEMDILAYLPFLCYWRSIEPDNAYVSDSIAALKGLEKGS